MFQAVEDINETGYVIGRINNSIYQQADRYVGQINNVTNSLQEFRQWESNVYSCHLRKYCFQLYQGKDNAHPWYFKVLPSKFNRNRGYVAKPHQR